MPNHLAYATKTWRRHHCSRHHRTYSKFVRCAIKRCAWVIGEGPWAVIAWCGTPTVTLHDSHAGAQAAIDTLAWCGGRCSGRHEIVKLVIE